MCICERAALLHAARHGAKSAVHLLRRGDDAHTAHSAQRRDAVPVPTRRVNHSTVPCSTLTSHLVPVLRGAVEYAYIGVTDSVTSVMSNSSTTALC